MSAPKSFFKKALTMAKGYAIILVTCQRAYFFVQKNTLQYIMQGGQKQEVPQDESQDYAGLHGVQTKKLRHNEKQEERSRQTRDEQVLQILQKAYSAQRNQVIIL